MIRSEQQPPISKAGVLAASGAVGVVLAGWMRLASGTPGWPVVVVIWLAAAAMLIPLCRATMPSQLRAPLVLALLATMLFGAVRADLFGTRSLAGAGQDIDPAVPDPATDTAVKDLPMTASHEGADVAIEAGRAGGNDWARAIDKKLVGRIGGAAARRYRITGAIDEDAAADGILRVAIDWSVGDGATTVSCGRTSVSGADHASIIDSLGDPIEQAVRRSVSLGRPSCP